MIYSSETSSEEEKPSSQTKEKYEGIKVMHKLEFVKWGMGGGGSKEKRIGGWG